MSRASHAHHTPHVGFAQIEPITSVSPLNAVPTSADDAASRSSSSLPFHRYLRLKTRTRKKPRNVMNAAGRCTYMIFCRSPMSRSGGEVRMPSACAATRKRMAKAPNHGQRPGRGMSRVAAMSVMTVGSGLDHMFKCKMGGHEKDDVVRDEHLHPGARCLHQVAAEECLRRFHRGEQHGNQHREEQQWKEHFARPAPARHRGIKSTERDESHGAERENADERRPRARD